MNSETIILWRARWVMFARGVRSSRTLLDQANLMSWLGLFSLRRTFWLSWTEGLKLSESMWKNNSDIENNPRHDIDGGFMVKSFLEPNLHFYSISAIKNAKILKILVLWKVQSFLQPKICWYIMYLCLRHYDYVFTKIIQIYEFYDFYWTIEF